MKRLKALLVGLLLTASGFVSASTPVLNVTGNLNGFVDSKTYNFAVGQDGLYSADFNVSNSSLALVLFGIYDKVGSSWQLVNGTIGSGSFTFTGNDALSYKAVIGDLNFSGQKLPYSLNVSSVTAVPEPETWALMLLGIALVIYQIRPRKTNGALTALA